MSASSSQALEYLELLPRQTHTKLYEQPSTVLAIFRCMLPHLAKSIVMAMLYMPEPFYATDLNVWIRSDAKSEKEKSLSVLQQLHIVSPKNDDKGQTYYELVSKFARSLRQALEGSGSHRSFGVPASQPDPNKVSIAFLDEYARNQWENILFYMVGSTVGLSTSGAQGRDLDNGTKRLLQLGNYITSGGKITREGFSFVLQETNAQVWSLLIVYLRNAPSLNMQETDVLSFLFMLGSLELGQDYTTTTLTLTQKHLLDDLSGYGLIYRSSKESTTFYPTRLAVTLTSDSGALSTEPLSSSLAPSSRTGAQKGFIIIETNYRLYAYTSSLLQIAVLSLFTNLTTRFPNLVSGKLTKKSISRAVSSGITSSQILSYLTAHAHPQMQRSETFIPPTVMDQIRLWEYEGERVETTLGFLMKEFTGRREYEDVAGYAESLGVLIWRDDKDMKFFVDKLDQDQSQEVNYIDPAVKELLYFFGRRL